MVVQPAQHGSASRPRPGVTLVELVIVFGVILVLLGILSPALRHARDRSADTVGLSDTKQYAALVHAYASSNDLYFPIADEPGAHPGTVTGGWWIPMVETGLLTRDEHRRAGRDLPKISMTAATDPRYLKRGQTVSPYLSLEHTRIRTSQVRSPSAWGMMFHSIFVDPSGYEFWWCCNDDIPTPVAFGDGSVGMYIWYELLPEGELYIENNIGRPVATSWGGIHGRSR